MTGLEARPEIFIDWRLAYQAYETSERMKQRILFLSCVSWMKMNDGAFTRGKFRGWPNSRIYRDK